ncbi:hypothetical protein [Paracoccus sp. (in: a-proteobacteria)]|uniref:hypothetical protein n=1 Tax=Paracoccus sp. TaxID=267 RepID=UPI002AFF8357|nr:hypothetical protein [Paracoccus sp. (in: a-proteobacteria)]
MPPGETTAPVSSHCDDKAPKRTIGNLQAALSCIEEVIEPDSLMCPCGYDLMHRIGEDRSEWLDIMPGQLCNIVTVGLKMLFMDETTAPALDPEQGRKKTGYSTNIVNENFLVLNPKE